MSDPVEVKIPIEFKTFIPPSMGPDNKPYPYDLKNVPHLTYAMIAKIENNIKQFGSVEKFLESFMKELQEKFETAENAVQVYAMRKAQLEFIRGWMKENTTAKDPSLDG